MPEKDSLESDQAAIEEAVKLLEAAIGSGESANSAMASLNIWHHVERGKPPQLMNPQLRRCYELLQGEVEKNLGANALDKFHHLEQVAAWAVATMFEARDTLGVRQPLLHQIGELASKFRDLALKEFVEKLLQLEKALLAEGKQGSSIDRLNSAWLNYFHPKSKEE